MKFVFVLAGSYKWFYLNQLKKLNKVDLIVFYQDIFYEYNYLEEIFGDGVVKKELIHLNRLLKCPILVCGKLNKDGVINRCFILCNNGKVRIIDWDKDIYLRIKNKVILISNNHFYNTKSFCSILFNNNYEDLYKKYTDKCFLCDKKNVTLINNGKIYRKFRKCCYFTLRF